MLRLHGLTLGYGREHVVENVDLTIEEGSFVSLVGPSGSGKSSILRAIANMLTPRAGDIETELAQEDIGFLFQDDALLPWRTLRENVALGLRIRGKKRNVALAEAEGWLTEMELGGLGDRYPHQVSGGQRKRAAIAQILCLRPRLILMDEPFASLDAILRTHISQELMRWVEREQFTVLLVTHDLEEAIGLSDRVHLLSNGPSATIRSSYNVPFVRPRHVMETRSHPRFGELLQQIWTDLSKELSFGRGTAAAANGGGSGGGDSDESDGETTARFSHTVAGVGSAGDSRAS